MLRTVRRARARRRCSARPTRHPGYHTTVPEHALRSASPPTMVLIDAAPIEPHDRQRIVCAFPQVRVRFAETREQMVASASEAEVIFAKGIPREALAAAQRLRWVQAGI